MSFSGNPLGQGARLDHSSFMKNSQPRPESPPEDLISNSPPRRGPIPLSYAYGAPTLGKGSPTRTSPNRIPSPTRSSSSSVRNPSARPAEQEEDTGSNLSHNSSSSRTQEPGAVRYARLKQRNQALGTSSYHPSAPGIILSPPNGLNLRDTSVNVATAFHQAAHYTMPSAPDYEKETHTNSTNRRIAPPPSKSRKPTSKTSTLSQPPDDVAERNGRAKSPVLEAMASVSQAIARAATSSTSYLLRENDDSMEQTSYQSLRIPDPPKKPPSQRSTKDTTQPSNSSYDYEAEENYMRGEGAELTRRSGHQKRKSTTMSASARLSLDNKAYRPPSDDEDDEEDFEEDGIRRKRKGKRKDEGKNLTTLPTIAYDKKKKRRSISRKSGVPIGEDEEVSGEEQDLSPAENRRSGSRPSSRPPSRSGSVPRETVPPSHPAHFQPPLDEVPETDEDFLGPEETDHGPGPDEHSRVAHIQSDKTIHAMESQTREQGQSRSFSLGGLLGRLVFSFGSMLMAILRWTIQAIAMIVFLIWTVVRGIYVVLVATPLHWFDSARRDLPWANFGKVAFFALAMLVAGTALRPPSSPTLTIWDTVTRWIPSYPAPPPYRAPTIPAESVEDLIARLTHIESALAELTLKDQQAQKIHAADQRAQTEVATRVELLQERIETEAHRALEAEEQFRAAAAKGLASIRSEFEILQSELQHSRGEDTISNEMTEVLRELQERVGMAEGEAREALDLGKASMKAGGSVGWWNKWSGSGEGKLSIKSSDGQDVTSLIGSLVDHAVSRLSKDHLAKPDFALYSAGGRIIPYLTSNTYEVKPNTWARYAIGAITGSGYAMGRPPVTALHPDIHVGNCWPFAGTYGQLGVLLARNVYISEFSIDHAPRDVAYDVRAAPRQMEVWGLVQGGDNIAKVREYQQRVREEAAQRAKTDGVPPAEEEPYPSSLPRSPHYIRLAQFSYDIHSSEHIQTFKVSKDIQEIGADFGVVVLLVKNNWGQEDFTCLYRLRVHGTDKDHRPYLLLEQDAP